MSPSSKRRGRPAREPEKRAERAETLPSSPTAPAGAETPAPPRLPTASTGASARFERLGPAAGVAYALLSFLGSSLLPIGRVEPEDSAGAIARQLADDRGRVSAGVLLTLFSVFFLLVFVGWLHRWLRDVEGERGWLSTVALAGGVLMVGAVLVVVLVHLGGTVLETYGPDPVIARTLLVLQWQAVVIIFVPTAAFVGATSLIGLADELLPKWLTYTGLAIAAGLLLPPVAYFPFLLSTLWTGMLAVVLLQRARLLRAR